MPRFHARLSRHARILGLAILVTLAPQGASAQDWWALPDEEFAETYRDMAFGTSIEDQSTVAWMLFARVNQLQTIGDRTVALWETWPSNSDTFRADAIDLASKVREAPDFQTPKAARGLVDAPTPNGDSNTEEVTRNMLGYDYIRDNGLYTKAGVAAYLAAPGGRVDLPIGAVDIKADWSPGAISGAYQFKLDDGLIFSLVGLHIMMKMSPTPDDPFGSEDPSWFWTTFEFNGNEGLDNARSFITYGDALAGGPGVRLLTEAGLGETDFVNYSSNGTQIQFADGAHANIVLGNTKMEDFAGVPIAGPPSVWTAWNSSCHTCHATAAYNATTGEYFSFDPNIGTGMLAPGKMDGFQSLDFIWSISFHAR